jgi:hypothetical protein
MFMMIFPVSMIAIGLPAHAEIINDPSWCGNTATNCVPIPHKPKCVRPSETRVSPGDSSYTRTCSNPTLESVQRGYNSGELGVCQATRIDANRLFVSCKGKDWLGGTSVYVGNRDGDIAVYADHVRGPNGPPDGDEMIPVGLPSVIMTCGPRFSLEDPRYFRDGSPLWAAVHADGTVEYHSVIDLCIIRGLSRDQCLAVPVPSGATKTESSRNPDGAMTYTTTKTEFDRGVDNTGTPWVAENITKTVQYRPEVKITCNPDDTVTYSFPDGLVVISARPGEGLAPTIIWPEVCK